MIKHVLGACAAVMLMAMPAAANSISTTFAGGNQFDGNMFDVTVGSNNITINSLNVNVGTGPMTIDFYVKAGTYVGSETNSAAWTLVSATAITGQGAGSMTPVPVTMVSLSAGATYGLYVTIDTNVNTAPYMIYTNGSNTYSNADLTLSAGTGLGGKFGSLAVIPDRTWNGTINYTVATAPEPAAFTLFALALPGLWLLRRRDKA
jgi:hypothetical protein